ncbi:major facilitator superfamily [Gordonia polyisoprenivorans VH2]|uniref:Major facilitator superfamily n=1 Tax=Gordonia polyisoprenivorans (strain DSM 44266 / VH2) TaxID=1112204 RepID=H6MUN3_GORPV|nr:MULTISPECIES: MFS transporter [Gordonia]AFA74017.1 major facilitator superfamily [Gordonia polyisoprenivorans VH2]MDF3280508.1 MFS transporter [Gordonia sp. N1V]OZC31130.1 MFS transporter [Gordonia polyisoprenivorans]
MNSPDTIGTTRRWAMLACSLIAAMTTTCVVSGIAYLIPALHAEGMSVSRASVLAAVPTVGLMMAIIGWGSLLDRHGERVILTISLSLTLMAAIATAVAAWRSAPFTVLAALLFLGGLSSGAANGASGRIVVGWFPAAQRGTAMGVRQMAQPLGIAVCALSMPAIAQHRGIAAALVVPIVVTALGLLACVLGIVDPPSARSIAAAPARNPYRDSWFLARVHAVSVLLVIPQSMLWTFVPTWLIVARHWSPATAGVLVTITQTLGALGRIAAGRWSDAWLSRMRPIRLIAVVAGVAMGVLALTDWADSPVCVVVMMVASIVSVADNGLAFTAIAEFAGPRWSGRGLGIQNTAQYLATAATTPLFGALITAVGFPLAFAASAVAPVIAAPLVPRDQLPQPEPVSVDTPG